MDKADFAFNKACNTILILFHEFHMKSKISKRHAMEIFMSFHYFFQTFSQVFHLNHPIQQKNRILSGNIIPSLKLIGQFNHKQFSDGPNIIV